MADEMKGDIPLGKQDTAVIFRKGEHQPTLSIVTLTPLVPIHSERRWLVDQSLLLELPDAQVLWLVKTVEVKTPLLST